VFLLKATNKSALNTTEVVLKEVETLQKDPEAAKQDKFVKDLLEAVKMNDFQRKAGILIKILQPLLFKYPMESLDFDEQIKMAHAIIFEPTGNNDTPLKYTAGMILSVPVDAELFNVPDHSLIKIALQTPDQKTILITPKSNDIIVKSDGTKRLVTKAVMSHNVWSEALNVELRIVFDVKNFSQQTSNIETLALCEATKVLVFPKAAKRGI